MSMTSVGSSQTLQPAKQVQPAAEEMDYGFQVCHLQDYAVQGCCIKSKSDW